VLSRVWQLFTGPVTQLLLMLCLSRAAQDYYIAIIGLVGLQVFLELGLHVVLINVASHEWSDLQLENGRITGCSKALARLVSLGRTATVWYAIVAILFSLVVAVAGTKFFETGQVVADAAARRGVVEWLLPWIAVVIVQALLLLTMPLTAILEGCHQLATINRIRFRSAVAGTVVVWSVLALGGGLWVLAASASVRLAGELWLIFGPFREFLQPFRRPAQDDGMDWKQEVLPLQWRAAIQGPLLWATTYLPGLMIFSRFAEGESGRLGMTWTILTAVQAASLAWVETRRPVFGAMIAAKRYQELDAMFLRMTRFSLSFLLVAACGLTTVVWFIGTRDEWLFVRMSERLLPVQATLLLAAGFLAYQPALCVNIYVRAHKRDPFLAASVISSVTLTTLQLWFGSRQGPFGVALGYMLGIGLVQTPLWLAIWYRTRQRWHGDEVST
jgi:hypothetical protein